MLEQTALRQNISWAKSTRTPSIIVFAILLAFTAFMWWQGRIALETRVDVYDAAAMYKYMAATTFAFFAGAGSILAVLFIVGTAVYGWVNQRNLSVLLGEKTTPSLHNSSK